MGHTKEKEMVLMDPMTPFDQAAGLLPFGLRQLALSMPQAQRAAAEELRLRAGRPMSVTMPEGETVLPGGPILSPGDLRTALEIATQASAHTAFEQVRHGFVTVRGGHRVGLCGTAVMKEGVIHNLRELSSLNIRIARQIPGVGDPILCQLRAQGALPSVLVLAPPGAGKTTLLRDLRRGLSAGMGGAPLRVGVADERGELGAVHNGVPQLELGPHTDVVDGCPKAEGLMMLLRGMNPQVLAVDEITAPHDIDALEAAAGCGVVLLATAHGRGVDDLKRRPLYRRVLEGRIFQKLLLVERQGGERRYRLEDLPC
jgi:stage III sporulation protein AA